MVHKMRSPHCFLTFLENWKQFLCLFKSKKLCFLFFPFPCRKKQVTHMWKRRKRRSGRRVMWRNHRVRLRRRREKLRNRWTKISTGSRRSSSVLNLKEWVLSPPHSPFKFFRTPLNSPLRFEYFKKSPMHFFCSFINLCFESTPVPNYFTTVIGVLWPRKKQ